MKSLFLIFTILFSFSVLADCCNSEIQFQAQDSHTYQVDGNHCSGSSDHGNESQHCHCSPLNHIKILASEKILVDAPTSVKATLSGVVKSFRDGAFPNSIFHPPIA